MKWLRCTRCRLSNAFSNTVPNVLQSWIICTWVQNSNYISEVDVPHFLESCAFNRDCLFCYHSHITQLMKLPVEATISVVWKPIWERCTREYLGTVFFIFSMLVKRKILPYQVQRVVRGVVTNIKKAFGLFFSYLAGS